MAIKGHLNEMSLPTLIQLACNEGGQARLSVRRQGSKAQVYFDQGNLVHAALGDQVGEEVVYQLLKWEDGEFSLEPGIAPPSRSIDTPWSALLMHGLQRVDEEQWGTDIALEEVNKMPGENLRDILTEFGQQVTGFMAAAVVGMDGLNIAEYASSPIDPDTVSAQMTLLVKLVDTTVNQLKAGSTEDNLLTTDRAYLLIRFLDSKKNYYLGFAVDRKTGNLGNMRLYSRLFAERLAKAMPR